MADDTFDAEIARRVVPVNHAPPVEPPGRREKPVEPAAQKVVKLTRRLAGLPAGRWELIVTITESGLQDWSLRAFGKVEQ